MIDRWEINEEAAKDVGDIAYLSLVDDADLVRKVVTDEFQRSVLQDALETIADFEAALQVLKGEF